MAGIQFDLRFAVCLEPIEDALLEFGVGYGGGFTMIGTGDDPERAMCGADFLQLLSVMHGDDIVFGSGYKEGWCVGVFDCRCGVCIGEIDSVSEAGVCDCDFYGRTTQSSPEERTGVVATDMFISDRTEG